MELQVFGLARLIHNMSLTTNLVNYYKLDDNGTDQVSANTLTVTSVVFSALNGKINHGAGFTDGSYDAPAGSSLNVGTNGSVAGWVKFTDLNNNGFPALFFTGATIRFGIR